MFLYLMQKEEAMEMWKDLIQFFPQPLAITDEDLNQVLHSNQVFNQIF
jgi:hypothetical protein